MFPVNHYDRFIQDLEHHENNNLPVTFGILTADYGQSDSREYILNYLDRFDRNSGTYINFYLPGYIDGDYYGCDGKIEIKGKEYYFVRELYHTFLEKLESVFGIPYPYTPQLILMEYDSGRLSSLKKIIIELDAKAGDIKRTGDLFEEIFRIAKKKVKLREFSNGLVRREFKKGLLKKIVKLIRKPFLNEIIDGGKILNTYKIK